MTNTLLFFDNPTGVSIFLEFILKRIALVSYRVLRSSANPLAALIEATFSVSLALSIGGTEVAL